MHVSDCSVFQSRISLNVYFPLRFNPTDPSKCYKSHLKWSYYKVLSKKKISKGRQKSPVRCSPLPLRRVTWPAVFAVMNSNTFGFYQLLSVSNLAGTWWVGKQKKARQTPASHVLMTCQSNTRCVHLLWFSASPRQLIWWHHRVMHFSALFAWM